MRTTHETIQTLTRRPRSSHIGWMARLALLADRAAQSARTDAQKERASRLAATADQQGRSWYEASRYSGSLSGPEDYPELARALRGLWDAV